jgi:hypothetical protein
VIEHEDQLERVKEKHSRREHLRGAPRPGGKRPAVPANAET